MATRYEKERDFHNKTFADDTRHRVEKFYAVTEASQDYYWHFLRDNGPGKDVLEYGCGAGSYARFLTKHGARVTGIDISDVAIEQCRERARAEGLSNIDYRVMNAEVLEFPDASFDLICGSAILHHLDLDRAYSELARTLRPDGQAMFLEPLGHNPLINLYRWATPALRTEDEHPLLMRDLDGARRYFGKIDMHFFHLQSLAAVPFYRLPGFKGLVRALDAADRFLFRVVPPARRFAWAVILVFSQPQPAVVRPIPAETREAVPTA